MDLKKLKTLLNLPKEYINKWRNRIPKKFTKSDYEIEYAFTSGGVRYYRFSNPYNMPNQRAFAMMQINEEFNMRCTKDFLQKHCEAIQECYTMKKEKGGLNIGEVYVLVNQLKERLDFIIEPDTALKLASVTFFDDKENIYDYDWEYNLKKISKWKKENDIASFFLTAPLRAIIPIGNLSEKDFRTYLKVVEEVNLEHLGNISTILSGIKRKKG